MKRLAWTAMLLAVPLLFASCRPTGPEPPAPTPPAAVAPAAPPSPADETGEPGQPEGDAENSGNTADESKKGEVLAAIARAVRKSVVGDTEKGPEEARPFAP